MNRFNWPAIGPVQMSRLCFNCHGSGRNTVFSFDGSGSIIWDKQCHYCDGRGVTPKHCKLCNGTGTNRNVQPARPCTKCGGRGRAFARGRIVAGDVTRSMNYLPLFIFAAGGIICSFYHCGRAVKCFERGDNVPGIMWAINALAYIIIPLSLCF